MFIFYYLCNSQWWDNPFKANKHLYLACTNYNKSRSYSPFKIYTLLLLTRQQRHSFNVYPSETGAQEHVQDAIKGSPNRAERCKRRHLSATISFYPLLHLAIKVHFTVHTVDVLNARNVNP